MWELQYPFCCSNLDLLSSCFGTGFFEHTISLSPVAERPHEKPHDLSVELSGAMVRKGFTLTRTQELEIMKKSKENHLVEAKLWPGRCGLLEFNELWLTALFPNYPTKSGQKSRNMSGKHPETNQNDPKIDSVSMDSSQKDMLWVVQVESS